MKIKTVKTFAMVLAAVMLLSLTLTSCKPSIALEQTKTHQAFKLSEGENFALAMDFMVEIKAYRQGNSYYGNFGELGEGAGEVIIIDRIEYEFDHDSKTAYYLELSDEEFEEKMQKASEIAWIDINDITFKGSGKKEFKPDEKPSMGKLFYEEFVCSSGLKTLVFFDKNDVMVGLSHENLAGVMVNFLYSISGEIPEEVLAKLRVPEGYERVEVERED